MNATSHCSIRTLGLVMRRRPIRATALVAALVTSACGDGSNTGNGNPPPSQNTAPSIAGVPETAVYQDDDYQFVPVASDPDGDLLRFSIANKPAWATFDGDSGELAGTPDQGDLGTTSGVTVSVTDGNASASLAPFDLEVLAPPTGSVTVTWDPPTTNEDGSTLTDLGGYRISYGKSTGVYSDETVVSDASATSVEVHGLSSDVWYFSVTAFDENSNESDRSNEVSKNVTP